MAPPARHPSRGARRLDEAVRRDIAALNHPATLAQRAAAVPLHCLGTTKDGHPRHPLYVPAATELVPYNQMDRTTP